MRRIFAAPGFAIVLAGCTPAPIGTPVPSGAPVVLGVSAEVTAVVDGDTIDVRTAAGTERVRIIGIDTPEIGRDGAADECYAQEAREYVNDALYGRTVTIYPDPTQDDVDRYGRLLRHVLVDDRSIAQDTLVAGMGYEYTYDAPYEGQGAHKAAQEAAAAAGAGLWSACENGGH
ncbi:thermonuclease family protein [Microbacterium imperiale]|uniref:thermonuclease family protein n=1 Tax=Microbacterium imperiale TaxID=33884 RepID=UPI001AE0F17B|nr:thermonuclease family protein [Microbacterium imperiale]MBP2422206.1 micrococcal nuclease [Microbacterium imperiale]MDS0200697.1 thermonuclease family protein [Microbacterium imperiale]